MKRVLQVIAWLVVLLAGFWFLGPKETVPKVVLGETPKDVATFIAQIAKDEAGFGDVTPGVEKRVVLAGDAARTHWVVVYVHGFSATSQEVRPLPDNVANALGANLFYLRLTGHGRPGEKLAEARAQDWIADIGQDLAAARALGDKVLVMGTSTGGTLAALAAADIKDAADAFVFLSPNFEINASGSELLTLPWARYWVPLIVGAERQFDLQNAEHARYWTTRYPTRALMPLAAVTKAAREADFSAVTAPLLVILADEDKVVKAATTRKVIASWPNSNLVAIRMSEGDDPNAHVIAGNILSPNQTDGIVARVLEWLEK